MMTDWQPIETAPKNETDILVATSSGGQYVVFWLAARDGFEHDQGGWYVNAGSGDGLPLYEIPTHWMSLPEKPR